MNIIQKAGRAIRNPTKLELKVKSQIAHKKYVADLEILRTCVNIVCADLTSSGDFSRATPENQESLTRLMELSKEVYRNNPKYQS